MMTTIIIRTRFVALHNWPKAPDVVSFLRNEHRHEFWVEVEIEVDHNDRDLEFFICKEKINRFIKNNFAYKSLGSLSCEMIAIKLYEGLQLPVKSISVFEDGENGAKVVR